MTDDLFEYLAETPNAGTVSVSELTKGGKPKLVGKFHGDSSDQFQEQFGPGDFRVKVYKKGGSGLVGTFEVFVAEERKAAQANPEPQNDAILKVLAQTNALNERLLERLENLSTQQSQPAQVSDPFDDLEVACNKIEKMGNALSRVKTSLAGEEIRAIRQRAEEAEERAELEAEEAKKAKVEVEELRREVDSETPGAIAKSFEKLVEKGMDKYGEKGLEAGQELFGKAIAGKKANSAIRKIEEGRAG